MSDLDAAEYLKQKMILLLEENADGLSKEELIRLTPPSKEMQVDSKMRAGAINRLLEENIVDMQRGANKGSFVLKLKKGTQLENATPEEQSVSWERLKAGLSSSYCLLPHFRYSL